MTSAPDGDALGITFLTPVDPKRPHWLDETRASIDRFAAQWAGEVRWVIVTDGPMDVVGNDWFEQADDVVTMPRKAGTAACRNVALSRATTEWIYPLDSDDLIAVGDTELLARTLSPPGVASWRHAECVAIAGNQLTFDGSFTKHRVRCPGTWHQDMLAENWGSPFAFHPNTMFVRTAAALRCGGWPAMVTNQDLGFALALNETGPIRTVDQEFVRYRQGDTQTTADPSFEQTRRLGLEFLLAGVNQRRQARGLKSVSGPTAKARALVG